MNRHLNLAVIIAIFAVPLLLFNVLKKPESVSNAAIAKSGKPSIIQFSARMCGECKKTR